MNFKQGFVYLHQKQQVMGLSMKDVYTYGFIKTRMIMVNGIKATPNCETYTYMNLQGNASYLE